MKVSVHIGINDYPGTGADLSGCVNDAKDWFMVARDHGFGSSLLLLDQDATKANMLEALRAAIEPAKYGDLVFITYSGHGSWIPDLDGDEPDHRDEVLVPWDYQSGVLTDDELLVALGKRKRGVRVIFVSDSCHSGSVNRFAMPLNPSRGGIRYLAPEMFLPTRALGRARQVEELAPRGKSRGSNVLISGCRDEEYSYDAWFGDRANGAFTRVAIDELVQRNPLTYREWHQCIRLRLPSQDYPQTPLLSGELYQQRWKPLEEGR